MTFKLPGSILIRLLLPLDILLDKQKVTSDEKKNTFGVAELETPVKMVIAHNRKVYDLHLQIPCHTVSPKRRLKSTGFVIQKGPTAGNVSFLKLTNRHQKFITNWIKDGAIYRLVNTSDGNKVKRTIASDQDHTNL